VPPATFFFRCPPCRANAPFPLSFIVFFLFPWFFASFLEGPFSPPKNAGPCYVSPSYAIELVNQMMQIPLDWFLPAPFFHVLFCLSTFPPLLRLQTFFSLPLGLFVPGPQNLFFPATNSPFFQRKTFPSTWVLFFPGDLGTSQLSSFFAISLLRTVAFPFCNFFFFPETLYQKEFPPPSSVDLPWSKTLTLLRPFPNKVSDFFFFL